MGESNNDFYLPEFEDSSKSNPSKNTPSKNYGELPTFEDEDLNSSDSAGNEPEVPRPPQELRSKPSRTKLQDIEDKYLQEEAFEIDLEDAKEELESRKSKNPVFINLQDYGHMISAMKSTKANLKSFTQAFQKMDSIDMALNNEIGKAQKTLELIQRKLITLDNHLFEGMEE